MARRLLYFLGRFVSGGLVGGEGGLERIFFAALASSSFFESLSVEAAFNASTCEMPLSLEEAALLALVVAEALRPERHRRQDARRGTDYQLCAVGLGYRADERGIALSSGPIGVPDRGERYPTSIMDTLCGGGPGKGSRNMIGRMRDGWRRFQASKPGHRFRDRYRRRRSGQGRGALQKVLLIIGGILIGVASILLAPLPGPGWGTLLLGLVIIA